MKITRIATLTIFVGSILANCVHAADEGTTVPAELADLKKQVDLEKQKNTIQAELLNSQKGLIDSQKGVVDSQTQLLGKQKDLLDALFPQITGGKTGSLTFESNTSIGSFAQPHAIRAVNSVTQRICDASSTGQTNASVIVGTEDDFKLMTQAKMVGLQLNGARRRL